ncbi:hypothetical protein J1N35_021653 [Gossypium stocksii]|uniref:Uncharacterized protein n=1 Tax=Gossypium stocksii TaxID=47602 RepID=A0A9D4A217_9ROSI|nr:hypothetical protein J1N35_021653 [Gossypium stocksii]
MSELSKSSEGLPPKEEVSLSSNLGEKVAMKTVKLELMRLNSSEASELVESLARLPPIREFELRSDISRGKSLERKEKLSVETKQRQIKSVPFRSRNESVVRMGVGECHEPQFKAHDHRTMHQMVVYCIDGDFLARKNRPNSPSTMKAKPAALEPDLRHARRI